MNPQEFEASTVWTTLDAVKQQVANDLHPIDDAERQYVRSIHTMVDYLESFRSVDPLLWDASGLDQVRAYLEPLKNSLDLYLSDKDAHNAQFAEAGAKAAQVISVGRGHFPVLPPADESLLLAKAASTRYRNGLDAEVERLAVKVDGFESVVDRAEEKLDAAQADFEAKKRAVEDEVAALSSTLDTQIKSQADDFTQASEGREAAFEDSLKRIKSTSATVRDEQKTAADALLDELSDLRDQARRIVDATSRHAVAGQYGTWASHQARAAFWWTIATTTLGAAVVGGLIWALSSVRDDSIQFVVYKISIGVLAAGLFGYAAKQAAGHREQERIYKRVALDLAALEPFLAGLDNASDLRAAVARRLFVPTTDGGSTEPASLEVEVEDGTMTSRQFVALLAAAVKAGKE